MSILRSCIEPTTCSFVRPECEISFAANTSGITPTTSPPSASAASATAPISPTLPPP